MRGVDWLQIFVIDEFYCNKKFQKLFVKKPIKIFNSMSFRAQHFNVGSDKKLIDSTNLNEVLDSHVLRRRKSLKTSIFMLLTEIIEICYANLTTSQIVNA